MLSKDFESYDDILMTLSLMILLQLLQDVFIMYYTFFRPQHFIVLLIVICPLISSFLKKIMNIKKALCQNLCFLGQKVYSSDRAQKNKDIHRD